MFLAESLLYPVPVRHRKKIITIWQTYSNSPGLTKLLQFIFYFSVKSVKCCYQSHLFMYLRGCTITAREIARVLLWPTEFCASQGLSLSTELPPQFSCQKQTPNVCGLFMQRADVCHHWLWKDTRSSNVKELSRNRGITAKPESWRRMFPAAAAGEGPALRGGRDNAAGSGAGRWQHPLRHHSGAQPALSPTPGKQLLFLGLVPALVFILAACNKRSFSARSRCGSVSRNWILRGVSAEMLHGWNWSGALVRAG